jgi:integrase
MNKPFFHKHKNAWYLQQGKKQVRLAESREEAFAVWHKMATETSTPTDISVKDLYADFLRDVEANASPKTVEWYRYFLDGFVADKIADMNAEAVIPNHVTSYMNRQKGWGQNTRHNFARAAKRLLKWGFDQGLLKTNPLARMAKPSPVVREDYVTDDVYDVVLQNAPKNLKDLVTLAWETGMRPQELFAIEARHVQDDRIVIPQSESKGRRSVRVVYLGTENCRQLIGHLVSETPVGKLLKNSHGNPWNKSSVKCAFARLHKSTGVKTHLGAFRKGYCTKGLKAGVDTVTMSHLMGHASTAMVSRVYAKVHHDKEHMLSAAAKVMSKPSQGVATPVPETSSGCLPPSGETP